MTILILIGQFSILFKKKEKRAEKTVLMSISYHLLVLHVTFSYRFLILLSINISEANQTIIRSDNF